MTAGCGSTHSHSLIMKWKMMGGRVCVCVHTCVHVCVSVGGTHIRVCKHVACVGTYVFANAMRMYIIMGFIQASFNKDHWT